MNARLCLVLAVLVTVVGCRGTGETDSVLLGDFDKTRDLYLAHFDLKTDVDDAHSVAAVATMLADERFQGVTYHAVAGAYGFQDGAYVPANDLFDLAFGERWSDAHENREQALQDVSRLATGVIKEGGTVWIAEGGQSDFSADVVREVRALLPEAEIKNVFHVVQHADWNEEVTTAEDLAYLKEETSYHRIPDGNGTGNGTPGFRSDEIIEWRTHVTDQRLIGIWERAIEIGNTFNGADDRYLNESVLKGGLDFSDASESTWIFGFRDLVDSIDFFREFGNATSN